MNQEVIWDYRWPLEAIREGGGAIINEYRFLSFIPKWMGIIFKWSKIGRALNVPTNKRYKNDRK